MKKPLLVLDHPMSLNNHYLAGTMQVMAEADDYKSES